MKRIILILAIAISFSTIFAETYRIHKLDNESININGKILKCGDSFSDKDPIYWSKSKSKFMICKNEKGRKKKLSAFISKNKTVSVYDFSIAQKNLSARNDILSSIDDHKKFLEEDSLVLFDSISFNSSWKSDSSSYFNISYIYKNQSYSKKLISKENQIYITQDMFPTECITNKSETAITCKVEYVELDYNERTLITDKLNIIIVPINKD